MTNGCLKLMIFTGNMKMNVNYITLKEKQTVICMLMFSLYFQCKNKTRLKNSSKDGYTGYFKKAST